MEKQRPKIFDGITAIYSIDNQTVCDYIKVVNLSNIFSSYIFAGKVVENLRSETYTQVEHAAVNRSVTGSSPVWGAIVNHPSNLNHKCSIEG